MERLAEVAAAHLVVAVPFGAQADVAVQVELTAKTEEHARLGVLAARAQERGLRFAVGDAEAAKKRELARERPQADGREVPRRRFHIAVQAKAADRGLAEVRVAELGREVRRELIAEENAERGVVLVAGGKAGAIELELRLADAAADIRRAQARAAHLRGRRDRERRAGKTEDCNDCYCFHIGRPFLLLIRLLQRGANTSKGPARGGLAGLKRRPKHPLLLRRCNAGGPLASVPVEYDPSTGCRYGLKTGCSHSSA